ncbi:MAG: PD40 domain-containing protein [Anaerolineae bacterium]|nr:PD40 domain-containing protein [Anaerolineae bacterium]
MVKSNKLIAIFLISLLTIIFSVQPTYAAWPPFKFELIPSYANGKITYEIEFRNRADWLMTNVQIKIPLPEGTRFIETNASDNVVTDFDGNEITFLIPVADRQIKDGSVTFTVEVIDPGQTIYSAFAWIAWEGNEAGDFLSEQVYVDITDDTVNWTEPPLPRLRFEIKADVTKDDITYFVYPQTASNVRMWDVEINMPIPDGTELVSTEAPLIFSTIDGDKEVSFRAIELQQKATLEPLVIKVSTPNPSTELVTTHIWATWKNSSRKVIQQIVAQEDVATAPFSLQPNIPKEVFFDTLVGDVPFSDFDLQRVSLKDVLFNDVPTLAITFWMAENVEIGGSSMSYRLYLDTDCNNKTGQRNGDIGAEYYATFGQNTGNARLQKWNASTRDWERIAPLSAYVPPNSKRVVIWVPYNLIEVDQQFCWVAITKKQFDQSLIDQIPTGINNQIARHQYMDVGSEFDAEELQMFTEVVLPKDIKGTFIPFDDTWQYQPGWFEPATGWIDAGFDDSDWLVGESAFGYGVKALGTDLRQVEPPVEAGQQPELVEQVNKQSGMILAVLSTAGDPASLFMRRKFYVDEPEFITQLTLDVRFRGGFIVYLNGVEVARRNLDDADKPMVYDTLAVDQDEKTFKASLDLSPYIPDLVEGQNVLAIQAHRAEGSTSLLMEPKLSWEFRESSLPETSDETMPMATEETSSPPSVDTISGKLAVPLMNMYATKYDVHIYTLPDGEEIATIPNARQPNFRSDGQRLLINREGGGVENVFEYTLETALDKQVSDSPTDWHPFYDPWGNRVVYGNDQLALSGIPIPKEINGAVQHHDKTGKIIYTSTYAPFIFLQCSLQPPHLEADTQCRNMAIFGILIPAGQMGDLRGSNPVWTSDDYIAYKGCNTWAGSASCGIYKVPSASTKAAGDGFIPRQLTRDTSDTPSDTKGNWIAFSSQRDGDWEAYVIDINGGNLRNVSNSSNSNDGLPTLSPDQNWAAFVSDRDDQWAVWVVPLTGGEPHKLFDLPTNTPWGEGAQDWLTERISWGP